jgi:hypothetical protein
MGAIIADFGKNEHGLNIFRINGTKEEIEKAIYDMQNLGFEVWGEPYYFEKASKHWSVLIKVLVPNFEEDHIQAK